MNELHEIKETLKKQLKHFQLRVKFATNCFP